MDEKQMRRLLKNLFQTQRLAVLATQGENGPYTSLMAFAATEDLRRLLFATDRDTRKYRNMSHNPSVALLIDNRNPERSRTHFAVTAVGKAVPVTGTEDEVLRSAFLRKHPDLREFLDKEGCTLFKCSVEEYVLVQNFQDVSVYRLG
ncbi:MAG: pyridoxamine 5'-phosphate oxidase family protein [Candidatus Abyssobacteria bacterium SURF_5]|uniref:Pyridoxamine 5'-phosphate oxidase family protein n=1 Tax=Abyssobacteria bacterium (strain SURF_5) TaxID=2093360 RepID=A0A3A4NZ84_ABYX5|nr:MAG: pyridoxamine 5'-phosphate oxidase family protein [Candidatus Abyssubacteria bacterium SURF_5]